MQCSAVREYQQLAACANRPSPVHCSAPHHYVMTILVKICEEGPVS